jgi:hypothetical protein
VGPNETKDISRETWKHFIPNAIFLSGRQPALKKYNNPKKRKFKVLKNNL